MWRVVKRRRAHAATRRNDGFLVKTPRRKGAVAGEGGADGGRRGVHTMNLTTEGTETTENGAEGGGGAGGQDVYCFRLMLS